MWVLFLINTNYMNIIFQIEGGIGKSIMATAVCEAIKKKYPEYNLIVITAYPEVFVCNPNVDKCLRFNELRYFYQDYIDGKKIKAFLHNPYFESDFIMQNEHLIKIWCDMFKVKYNGEKPKIYLTEREINYYTNQFESEKPIMVIQTNGGANNQPVKYSWARDLPYKTAQYVVNNFSKDYNIIHIRREDQLHLNNVTPFQSDFRSLAVLIKIAKKRLFIDSFAQHTAKALDCDSVVCWIANSPNQFGYENNINILAKEPTVIPELKNSVFSKYNIGGDLLEFPYRNEDEIFDVEEIIDAVNKL